MNLLAMQLGLQSLPERPKSAPVRTHRLRTSAVQTPDLHPPANSASERAQLLHEQRKAVVRALADRGRQMHRSEIADATGIEEMMVGKHLTEIRKAGLVRVDRVARRAMWELVDQEDV